ncbi:MAG: response regulator, partial [Candidatus Eisenbacteria bacterium]|nr:response regulator [Candidatus Eisenbacteria bacterium]
MKKRTQNRAPAGASPETRDRRILLADDDKRVLDILRQSLEGRGYLVQTFMDGRRALQYLQGDGAILPDLIVLDLRMPQSNGLRLCQTLRSLERTRRLPIILISDQAGMDHRVQALKLGADDYITKPFFPRELVLRIQNILQRITLEADLSRRVQRLEAELAAAHDARREAQEAARRGRRCLVDTTVQLTQSLRAGGLEGLGEAFSRAAGDLWGIGAFAYLRRTGENFTPVVSRGLPPTILSEWGRPGFQDGWRAVPPGRPVLVDSLPSQSPLGALRMSLSAAGLRILVPAGIDGEIAGLLLLGDPAVDERSTHEVVSLARSLILIYDSLWQRARREQGEMTRMGRLVAAWFDACEDQDFRERGASQQVGRWCAEIAAHAGLSDEEQETCRLAGRLHRIADGLEPLARSSSEPIVADRASGKGEEPHPTT